MHLFPKKDLKKMLQTKF